MTFEEQPSRILAIDYGRRRIGIAVTDALGITAQSLPTLTVNDTSDAVNKIKTVAGEYDSVRIVLGLPVGLSGTAGRAAEEVQKFGLLLQKQLPNVLSVDYFDERFTSKQAERTLIELNQKPSRNKEKIDSLSAVFILQGFLGLQETKRNRPYFTSGG